MTKILGLDLGIASIGWSIINHLPQSKEHIATGVKVIPVDKGKKDEFATATDKNQARTQARGARRGNYRFKLRRETLKKTLKELGVNLSMISTENDEPASAPLLKLTPLQLYELRAKAAVEKISLDELGRVLLLLNKKRGFKSNRKDQSKESEKSDYKQQIEQNVKDLQGRTIGQYQYDKLRDGLQQLPGGRTLVTTRLRGQVFTRAEYEAEFDRIWDTQSKYHSHLTPELKKRIKKEIIFFQRDLKSQKHLVSVCAFEKITFRHPVTGKEIVKPLKVAPKSSPIFQEFRILQDINHLEIRPLRSRKGQKLDEKQRKTLYDLLQQKEKLETDAIMKALKLDSDTTSLSKLSLIGNQTKVMIRKALKAVGIKDYEAYLNYSVSDAQTDKEQAYFWLWHILYSVSDPIAARNALVRRFDWTEQQAETIVESVSFPAGYAGLSAQAMRKMIPWLMQGMTYDKAAQQAGYRHSDFETKEEQKERQLLPISELKHITRGNLRNPAVEKVLNHLINLLKELVKQYGPIDEVRVELARNLKQSKEERLKEEKRMRDRAKINEQIENRLKNELNFTRVTRRDIEKYSLWEEFGKISPYRPYKEISLAELFSPAYEIEHIIPRSRLLDDSRTNKVIAHVEDNKLKGNTTAIDFMKTHRPELVDAYLKFVDEHLNSRKISRAKYNYLLCPQEEIKPDFLNRDLGVTRYIVRKTTELLSPYFRSVQVSSGAITDYLRHTWGYDSVLENIMLPLHKAVGHTELREQKRKENDPKLVERILDWDKRSDHRHHGLDALVIACTTQKDVHFINNLNTEFIPDADQKQDSRSEQLREHGGTKRLIPQPFTVAAVTDIMKNTLVTFKQGSRLYTKSKQKAGKKRINKFSLTPRGELHEQTIYGKVKVGTETVPVKKLTEAHLPLLCDTRLRDWLIQSGTVNRLGTKGFHSFDYNGKVIEAVRCRIEEVVIRYNLDANITLPKLESIIDPKVKALVMARLEAHNGDIKAAFKDLNATPIYYDEERGIVIKSVRCKTGITGAVQVRRGWVKTGSNYATAIYENTDGKKLIELVSFFEAINRVKNGLKPILQQHPEKGTLIGSIQANELFVFGIDRAALAELLDKRAYHLVTNHLYYVQKMSLSGPTSPDIMYRRHTDTTKEDAKWSKDVGNFIRVTNLEKVLSGIKVRMDAVGRLSIAEFG